MNGLRSRLRSLYLQSCYTVVSNRLKALTPSWEGVSRQMSDASKDGSTPGDEEKSSVYIPRRIQKRMKKKNLNIEEYEVVPVYKNSLKQESIQSTLADSMIDTGQEIEFPSDIHQRKEFTKDVKPKKPRSAVNPEETSILLFPGQGSQVVGMGKSLLPYPQVAELYERASNILGYDLLNICLNGPKEKLDKTIYCQPALFVTSLAGVERLKEDIPEAHSRCTTAAGFSLGEITALVYGGAMAFEDGLRFIQARAEAMQEASEMVSSGLMSVFCDHKTKLNKALMVAREYCKSELGIEEPVCYIANYLCTEVKVVGGHEEALQFIEQYGQEFGIRRTKRLPVSGAFHTALMKHEDSIGRVKKVLARMNIVAPPSVRVHSNLTGQRYGNGEEIRKSLLQQIYKPVRWEQLIQRIYNREPGMGFPNTYEIGPRRELGLLLKTINFKAYANYKHISV